MRKYIVVILVFALCAFLACGNESKNDTEKTDSSGNKESAEVYDSIVLVMQGVDGKSVFDLLEEQHKVDYIGSAVGNFVKAIDSVEINSDFGWMFSVNDTMGKVASDKYITSDSDVVKWHYRRF